MNYEKEYNISKETVLSSVKKNIKHYFFRKLTKSSNHLFLRGGDIISIDPQIIGIHEEKIRNSIKHYTTEGYKDFLIDIGANIGLTSCQSGLEFSEIHMFEPNPLCCKILEVNTSISLEPSKITIHKYGLGAENKNCLLTIPKHNWGGAFINDETNSYTKEILSLKDGLENFDSNNYLEVEISIKDTEQELKGIFESLANKGLHRGVIKIDVEGYEESVLIGIAKSIPKNIQAVIFFESWDKNFNLEKITDTFDRKIITRKIVQSPPWGTDASKLRKILSLILNQKYHTKIKNIEGDNFAGDLILEVF
ncbi:FkbM family methyltransferase [Curvibacter lanceolatus]|uniref:FkbM family methyltransferase n=1 Tax=Curvibacter lanceolatus TaxID=86182 RepID=UPI000A054CF6|nr:FkbM family methyltransferase [Curvibacter lanceolatus]